MWAYDAIKPDFNYDGIYVSATNVSLFHYDNGTFIAYAHVTGQAHPIHATIHIQGEEKKGIERKLIQHFAPRTPDGDKEIELREVRTFHDLKPGKELVGEVILNPGEFYEFSVERRAF